MAAPVSALLPTRANKTAAKTAGSAAPAANQAAPQEPSRQLYPLHPALPLNPSAIPADTPSDGRASRRTSASESPLWVQCKLAIGASDDPLESEADRAAEDVMRMDDPVGIGSPAPPQLRQAAANGPAAGMWNAPPLVHEALGSPGRPLDRETQAFMEPRFGRDLSAVRIHTGAQAAASARAIKARAYTAGNQIVWDAGSYAPHTDVGKRLLAHELAHVVQQGGVPPGRNTTIRRQPAGAVMDPPPAPAQESPQPADGADAEQGTKEIGKRDSQMQDKAEANLPGLDKMGSKAAKIRDSTKNEIQGKVQQALQSPAPATAGKQDDAGEGAEKSLAGLSTGNLALIDTELAEHQRWGAAASKVGATGSGERAEFIAESAAGGSNFLESLGKGAATGAGIKLVEKGAEKGALRLAAKFAPAVGKFAPLPAVGAVIGGVMSAYDLASRDWKATGETIGRFGEGADVYDTLANSIESISTIIDVATGILNVIAGIIGAISIAMWIITIVTVGVASPLALTLSTIAGAIGLASMVLDGINSLVLKQLVTIFRALHTFTSEADPRDVVTQGNAIGLAAGAATGFLGGLGGGLAGGAIAEKGLHMASGKPTPKVPDHPNPGAGSGDGPSVKAEPGEKGAGASHETAPGGEPGARTAEPVKETLPETTPAPAQEVAPATPQEIPAPGAPEVKPEVKPPTESAPSKPAPIEIPELPEAPKPIEITAVPEKPVAPEGTPTTEAPTSEKPAATAAEEAPVASSEEKAPADGPEAETAPESAPESEQKGGGDDGKPKEKPLSKKEQDRLKKKIRNGEDLTKEDIEKLAQHAGVSPKQVKAEINRVEIEGLGESTGMKDEDARIVHDQKVEPYLAPDRVTEIDPKTGKPKIDPKTGKVVKKTVHPRPGGRFEVDPGVKQDLRAQAREEAIGHVSGEPEGGALTDQYTERTRELMEYESQIDELKANAEAVAELRAKIEELPPEQREALQADLEELLEQKKEVLRKIQFHHLDTVADHPHTAGSRKSGLLATERIHAEAGHGKGGQIDHSFPIEGGVLRDEAAIKPADAHVDPQSLPGGRKPVEQGAIPSNRKEISRYRKEASEAKSLAKKSADAAAKATKNALAADEQAQKAAPGSKEAKQAASRADKLRERAQEHQQEAALQEAEVRDRELKIKKIEEGLPKLDAIIRNASPEARRDLGRPANQPPKPAATPAAPAAVPTPVVTPQIQSVTPVPEMQPQTATQTPAPAGTKPPETTAPRREAGSDRHVEAISATPPIVQPGPVLKAHAIKIPAAPEQPALAPQPAPITKPAPETRPGPVKPLASSVAPKTAVDAAPAPEPAPSQAPVEQPAKAPKPPVNVSHLPPAAHIGAKQPKKSEGKDSEEPESGLMRNIRAIGEMDPSKMSTAEKSVFIAGGPLAGTAGVNAMRGFEEARREPIVEHVNPNYAPPPCTPQDIVDVENQILETLDARAQSEKAAAIMAGQQAHHKANEKPLANVQERTEEAISATEAHKQAVERRTQANEKKKEKEDQAQGTLADYSDRAAKLSVITVPMRGFHRFTSLAYSLPESEDDLSTLEEIAIEAATPPWESVQSVLGILVSAKHAILKANADSGKFLEQLDSMDNTIEEQKTAHGERDKQVAADASTLKETGKNADQSGEELNKAQETSKDLDAKNKDRITEASLLHHEASKNAITLDGQAQQKQGQAQNLASSLQEWAQIHQQARKDSLEETKSRLEQQGYRITEVKEL